MNMAWIFRAESSVIRQMRFAVFVPKGQAFMASLSLFSRLNLLPKRVSSLARFVSRQNAYRSRDAFCWFCAKNSIRYAMVRRHLQRLLSNGAISRLSVLNVSLSLLSRSTWLGTPLVRTSMETEGPFSPLTPWRRQMPCVHELVSWSKVNSSEYHSTV